LDMPGLVQLWWVLAIQSWIVKCQKSDLCPVGQDSYSHASNSKLKFQLPENWGGKCKLPITDVSLLLAGDLQCKQHFGLDCEFWGWCGRIRKLNCIFWLWCCWIRKYNHEFTPTIWQNQKLQYYNVAESEVSVHWIGVPISTPRRTRCPGQQVMRLFPLVSAWMRELDGGCCWSGRFVVVGCQDDKTSPSK